MVEGLLTEREESKRAVVGQIQRERNPELSLAILPWHRSECSGEETSLFRIVEKRLSGITVGRIG